MDSPIKLIDVRDDERAVGDLQIFIGMLCVNLTLAQAEEIRALLNEQHQADEDLYYRLNVDPKVVSDEERLEVEARAEANREAWERLWGKP